MAEKLIIEDRNKCKILPVGNSDEKNLYIETCGLCGQRFGVKIGTPTSEIIKAHNNIKDIKHEFTQ